MRSRSDRPKGFLSYLLEKGHGIRVLAVLLAVVCAVSLLSFGRRGDEESGMSQEEERLAQLLSSIEGVGACEVSIRSGTDGEVLGIAVLCEGAGSVQTRERIVTLVSTLYHVGTHRITVEKLAK